MNSFKIKKFGAPTEEEIVVDKEENLHLELKEKVLTTLDPTDLKLGFKEKGLLVRNFLSNKGYHLSISQTKRLLDSSFNGMFIYQLDGTGVEFSTGGEARLVNHVLKLQKISQENELNMKKSKELKEVFSKGQELRKVSGGDDLKIKKVKSSNVGIIKNEVKVERKKEVKLDVLPVVKRSGIKTSGLDSVVTSFSEKLKDLDQLSKTFSSLLVPPSNQDRQFANMRIKEYKLHDKFVEDEIRYTMLFNQHLKNEHSLVLKNEKVFEEASRMKGPDLYNQIKTFGGFRIPKTVQAYTLLVKLDQGENDMRVRGYPLTVLDGTILRFIKKDPVDESSAFVIIEEFINTEDEVDYEIVHSFKGFFKKEKSRVMELDFNVESEGEFRFDHHQHVVTICAPDLLLFSNLPGVSIKDSEYKVSSDDTFIINYKLATGNLYGVDFRRIKSYPVKSEFSDYSINSYVSYIAKGVIHSVTVSQGSVSALNDRLSQNLY